MPYPLRIPSRYPRDTGRIEISFTARAQILSRTLLLNTLIGIMLSLVSNAVLY